MNVGIVTYRGRIASMGILKDITSQKQVEKLIKESEEKYRNIVELTTDMIYISDKNGKMVFLNDAGYRILEASPVEVIGNHWSKWVYPKDMEKSFKKFTEMINEGTDVFEFENRYISKNGKVTSLLHNVKFMKNENGDIVGTQGIARDITERKKVEERLRLFSEAVENAPDGVQITDLQGRIIYSNNVVEEIYGFSNEELKGKNVNEMNADSKFAEKVIIPSLKNTGRWKGELMVRHKKGFEFLIWLTTSMVKDKKGSPIAMVGIIRDITERKMVEKALIESETRYRTLFESAGDAIFILEAEGEEKGWIVAANRTAAQMHGYSIDELLTLNIVNLDTPESSMHAPDFIRRILNGETIKAELDHCRKDGTVFPIEIIARLLEIGGHKYILAFDRDITERKRAQEALRLSNLVVENSQTVLFRWKAQEGWPVEYVSNNVVQFGYGPEEFLSGALPYASIIHPDDLDRVSKEVQGYSQRSDDRFAHEYRIIARNGTIHWIEDRIVIERNRDGQITHYQGIIIDITERKYIEEAIKKYNMELEESNRIKELFTDIMHHDLLNPLNVAHGYVELFLEDETNNQKKSYLETIKRNLIKGMELIENATKFSKLESMDHIEFEDMDLKMVIGEVIENINPLALRAGMIIENNLKSRMPARANKIIEDIFINLITNAIKYAPEGKRIVVDSKEDGNFWIIRVVDFGPGIKDADKKSIFERFQREEKKGVKGSGLGLAIAGKIVNLHKGRIWVEDNPEGGAIFEVEIPGSTLIE
jgi:PAS domain S-box-containing protein